MTLNDLKLTIGSIGTYLIFLMLCFYEWQSHVAVSQLLQKIQPLKDNEDIERLITAELLTVLAGSVKAIRSNQLEFNFSISALVDLFLRIFACAPKVSRL